MQTLNIILRDRWFRITLVVAFIQQCIVATGTYLLGKIAANLASGQLPWYLCLGLFACMTISGSFIFYYMNISAQKSQKGALKTFFEEYFQISFNHPTYWRHGEEQSKRHDMLCREGQESIANAISFFLDAWTTTWNVLLNSISVVAIIGTGSGLTILGVGVLTTFLVHRMSQKIADAAAEEIENHNQLNRHVARSWDNLVLGNVDSFQIWYHKFLHLFEDAFESTQLGIASREKTLAIADYLTSSCVVGSAIAQAFLHRNNIGAVIGIFALLPRMMQIVMHLRIVQSHWANWQRHRTRLEQTDASISEFPVCNEIGSDVLEKLAFFNCFSRETISLQDFWKALTLGSGRIQISGPNGVGKSLLLANLKEKLSDRAYYLPAQHSLCLEGVNESQSMGERAVSALGNLLVSDCPILLLDEWDANLSVHNRQVWDARIGASAGEKLIIEVRHVGDATLATGSV